MTLVAKVGVGAVLWTVVVVGATTAKRIELNNSGVLVVAFVPAIFFLALMLLLGTFTLLTSFCLLVGRFGWWLERGLDWLEGKRIF